MCINIRDGWLTASMSICLSVSNASANATAACGMVAANVRLLDRILDGMHQLTAHSMLPGEPPVTRATPSLGEQTAAPGWPLARAR